jgi:hypothetical protein
MSTLLSPGKRKTYRPNAVHNKNGSATNNNGHAKNGNGVATEAGGAGGLLATEDEHNVTKISVKRVDDVEHANGAAVH